RVVESYAEKTTSPRLATARAVAASAARRPSSARRIESWRACSAARRAPSPAVSGNVGGIGSCGGSLREHAAAVATSIENSTARRSILTPPSGDCLLLPVYCPLESPLVLTSVGDQSAMRRPAPWAS